MSVTFDLQGKKAIVTGGGDGIGKATSLMLAESGADIVIADINAEKGEAVAEEIRKTYGTKALFKSCDVSSVEQLESLVNYTLEEFGRIDILNHIAGLSRRTDFLDATEKEFDLLININLKGTFFLDQMVLKAMIPNRAGKIVNMSSQSGKEGFPTNVAYTAAKFGVIGVTQAVAKLGAPYSINANAVCPGIIRTAIWEGFLKETAERGGDADAYWKERVGGIPLGRPQTVEDIAHMVLYLSSPFADNITGQAINVSGGTVFN